MRPSTFFFSFVLAATAACGGSPSDTTASTKQASTQVDWQAAIRCDGATLDVNPDERRDLQFVIRDPNAVLDLTNGSVDLGNVQGAVNAKGEFILTGHVQHGIFHAYDFQSAQVSNPYSVNGSFIAGVVEVAGENADVPGAGGGGDPSDLLILFGEYTNWRFRNCRQGF